MLKWLTKLEHLPVLPEPLKVVELNVNFFSTTPSPQHLSCHKLIQIWDLALHFHCCFPSEEQEPKRGMMFELESDCIIIAEAFLNPSLRIHNSFSVTSVVQYEGQQVLCALFDYKEYLSLVFTGCFCCTILLSAPSFLPLLSFQLSTSDMASFSVLQVSSIFFTNCQGQRYTETPPRTLHISWSWQQLPGNSPMWQSLPSE